MRKVRRINLALQGGGAHGAFTWGVLDRLLQEEWLEIAGISGTSAGALNGAALKSGWLDDGRAGARRSLDWLWRQMGAVGDLRVAGWFGSMFPTAAEINQAMEALSPVSPLDIASRLTSPYAWGPGWRNPLERVVTRFRFDQVCATEGPSLFVSATNVRTGKIRVFSGDDITSDALLASACLPTIFRAVEIADPATGTTEAYWDGGYAGNPALFPLFAPALPDDILIVNINPLRREAIPTTPAEIQNRINEISFNAPLLRDLRAINFVKELIAEGRIPRGAMKDVRVHMIADDDLMNQLSAATKVTPTPYLLFQLKQAGRAAAEAFLAEHADRIGTETTVDLAAMFG